ncbi:hypothetical protein NBRC10512_001160 [Rhodotorula toruloides]|uniref:RHTO0S11e01266g1_1 n=2 Tax=Rhodotorula toruloides TaxID=5286 RepID=A0A061BC97_RHOTO|nr:uncharacterized protein RHTO_03813 [Rhodotorula toruloides NP11]EMS20015.1 hypothetical protein RHTO_03813 [Rhodotorula toruloides NP11]CDR45514.1 RHTO0S11e01266g1_1 [Rhodotorula toruloides]
MTATLSARNAATPPLLRLPHELLDYIFTLAYSDYNDDLDDDLVGVQLEAQRRLVPAGTVCRALQPFVTKHLYGRIHFSSQTAFASFCTVLLATPQLASLVTDLRISLANELYRHYDAVYGDRAVPRSVEAANGPMTVPAGLVSAAASSLVNLRSLILDRCPSALGDPLLLDSTPTSFPQLLVFNSNNWKSRSGSKQGQIDLFARLATFPYLIDLRLSNPMHRYPLLPRIGECTLSFPSLASLRVDGSGFGSESLSYDIGAFFPNLRVFDVYDLDEDASILPLLGTLPCTLQHLYLDRTVYEPEVDVIDIIPSLAHLPHLQTLILAHATFTPQSILRHLHSSPQLRHLGFGQASGITDNVLAEIATLPQIATLELDHVIGRKGIPLLEQASLEQLKLLPELWEPYDWDWQKPYFPPGVTLEGIKVAAAMARSNGIVVEGTALDVPEDFDEAWQREIVSVVNELYIKTGDLSMLGELDVTLSEVLEYVRGTVLSLREKHGVPTPPIHPS